MFAAAAILVVLVLATVGLQPVAVPLLYLAVVTPTLWVTDTRERRLPNREVLPGYPVALISIGIEWLRHGHPPVLALLSGVAYLAFMAVLNCAGGMGMGDVKLAGVLGLCAGAIGPVAAAASPAAAFLLGGVAALAKLRGGHDRDIPFGPYMLAGLWIAVVLAGISPGGSST